MKVMSKPAVKQILRFSAVGATSGLVNMGIYNGALFALRHLGWCAGFDFLVAQAFGFLISVAWSFFLNRRYVFVSPEERSAFWLQALVRTYLTYFATGIGLSSILSLFWVYVLHIPKEVLTLLNDTLCFPVNYLLIKYWSFRKTNKR